MQLPPGFLADWAVGGARAAPLQRAQAPAQAPATADEEGLRAASARPASEQRSSSHRGAERGPGDAPYDAALERVASCAVSLAFLSDFYRRCVAPLERDGAPLTTKDVVARIIMPATRAARCSFASLVPGAVAPPTAFASHAFGNPLRLLVTALEAHFMNAVARDVHIWVDIFAINQHDPGTDLHGGRALVRTIELVGETVVVLDRGALPLTRLWCLYEIGSTPPHKLQLLTPGFYEAHLTAAFSAVDVEAAQCFDAGDTTRIRQHIVAQHASLAAFQQMLRLRLLLKPTSYEADRAALLARNTDTWRADALRAFAAGAGDEPRLACIVGGAGDGKSTLAAALCDPVYELVHAHHFCKVSDARRQDVGEVIRSLAYQLALRFPPFAEALLDLGDSGLLLLSDPARAWRQLLKEPLQRLRGERVMILVDALDEAGGSASRISAVLSLVLDLGRLADGPALSVIVTTRPEPGIIAALRGCWRENARDFAPASLRAGGELPRLLELLSSRCKGAPFDSVDEAYGSIFDVFAMLPMFDAAVAPAADGPAIAQLLSILVAARQPPSMALLEAFGLRAACAALPGWGLFFEEREHCVHVLHRSLAEWLQDARRSGRHAVDVGTGHRAWAEMLSMQLRPWLQSGTPSLAPPKGSYAYAHLLPHLDAAGRGGEAKATLLRLPWLQATLRERGLYALLADVAARMAPGDGTLSLLHRTLRLAAPGLQGSDAAEALPAQLVGRLGGLIATAAPEIVQLYRAAYSWRGGLAWLRPIRASLLQPLENALDLCLEGHVDAVSALAVLPDGRIVSGSADCSLAVWDAVTGECERELLGHNGAVTAVVALTDGRVLSGSDDATLRIWHAATGECERVLKGHRKAVRAVLALADGRAASASDDKTVRLWDVASGACALTLKGHTGAVMALMALSNGRLASGSADTTVRVWWTRTGECERTLRGHAALVCALAALPDGRIASGSVDDALCVWDVATGACQRMHAERARPGLAPAMPILALPGGRIVASSADSDLRVWSAASGACLHTLAGHDMPTSSLVALPDGRVVSASWDNTLRVWDVAAGECVRTLRGHTEMVKALLALPDGRLVSGAQDKSLRVWDLRQGARAPEGHTQCVTSLTALADGRVVSSSYDATLRLWNAATGACERVLAGHTDWVQAVVALPDGRVVSGSDDATLRVWAAASGACLRTLRDHTDEVYRLEALADGRVVSASADATLRVWDMASYSCVRVVREQSSAARRLLALPRLPQVSAQKSPWCRSGVSYSGASLGGDDFAATFTDAAGSALIQVTWGGAPTVVVAGTQAGGVHFFTVRDALHDDRGTALCAGDAADAPLALVGAPARADQPPADDGAAAESPVFDYADGCAPASSSSSSSSSSSEAYVDDSSMFDSDDDNASLPHPEWEAAMAAIMARQQRG